MDVGEVEMELDGDAGLVFLGVVDELLKNSVGQENLADVR